MHASAQRAIGVYRVDLRRKSISRMDQRSWDIYRQELSLTTPNIDKSICNIRFSKEDLSTFPCASTEKSTQVFLRRPATEKSDIATITLLYFLIGVSPFAYPKAVVLRKRRINCAELPCSTAWLTPLQNATRILLGLFESRNVFSRKLNYEGGRCPKCYPHFSRLVCGHLSLRRNVQTKARLRKDVASPL